MKVNKFAVSVMYGEGFHYFVTYCSTKESALEAGRRIQQDRNACYKKGAKPTVHTWELLESNTNIRPSSTTRRAAR